MDVFDALARRRSIRKYVALPVPEDKLQKVLQAAQAAPSASNRQEYKFIVVRDQETRERLVHAASDQGFLAEAGVVIVACATDPSHRWHAVDVAIAIDHMTLAAVAEGLGTCWIGAFEEGAVKSILGTTRTSTTQYHRPSTLSQIAGVALTGLSIYAMFSGTSMNPYNNPAVTAAGAQAASKAYSSENMGFQRDNPEMIGQ